MTTILQPIIYNLIYYIYFKKNETKNDCQLLNFSYSFQNNGTVIYLNYARTLLFK